MAKKKKETAHPASYLGRVIANIELRAERTGVDVADIHACIIDTYGKSVNDMDGSDLKRVAKELDPLVRQKLTDGASRLGDTHGMTDAGFAAVTAGASSE